MVLPSWPGCRGYAHFASQGGRSLMMSNKRFHHRSASRRVDDLALVRGRGISHASLPRAIPMSAISDFTATFRGELLSPSTPDYDEARKVWNGMVDRHPAHIARCKSVADVQSAIRYGRENKVPIAIRGGGHNAAGLGVCDDGIVIDLRGLADVIVDRVQRIARVGGGATWADLDRAAAAHGLATVGGAVSTTGVAGLTLGGGL